MTAATVQSPRTLVDALVALAGASGPAASRRLLAGGTDLMVELHSGRSAPRAVVDLWGIDELRGIRRDADGLRVFALTTCSDLLASAEVAAHWPLLQECCREFGAPQIQNRATIGGNLGTASPASDLLPVLLALDASVRFRSRTAARDVAIAAFATGYRAHCGRPDELIESVWLPPPAPGTRAVWRKVGPRRAQAIAKVGLALAVTVAADGAVAALRGAAASVAPTAVLLPSLQPLIGGRPDAAAIAAVARTAALADVAPIDDVRSTADYRRHVLQRLLRTELQRLLLTDA